METRALTRSAILAAVLVILGMVMLGTGIGYSLYVDGIVPIMMVMIYLCCGFKFAVLAAVDALLMTFFGLGNFVGSILMSQGVLIGMCCGLLLPGNRSVMDDLIIASLMGAVLMLIIDFYFATFIGYSLLDELPNVFSEGLLPQEVLTTVFYMSVASVPIGSMLLVYIGSLWFGHRLKVLNKNGHRKYQQLRYFKRLRPYICCSPEIAWGATLLSIVTCLLLGKVQGSYMKALIFCTLIICVYFLMLDGMMLWTDWLGNVKGQVGLTRGFPLLVILGLCMNWVVMIVVIVGGSLIIDLKYQVRRQKYGYLQQMTFIQKRPLQVMTSILR